VKKKQLRLMISDPLWERLQQALSQLDCYITKDTRNIIEGILWRQRTGAPWRDIPAQLCNWEAAYARFNDWSYRGIWKALFMSLRGELDAEWNFIDGSYIKAHQHASGARIGEKRDIGKSKGGNTTKIHMSADGCGNPVDFVITGGEVHDVKAAPQVIEFLAAENTVGDKGYDSDPLRQKIRDNGSTPIIPRRENSKKPNPEFDSHIYRLRHLVENIFARLKHFRAVATRYDKLSRNFQATVYLACAWIWIKL
jgi:transposase